LAFGGRSAECSRRWAWNFHLLGREERRGDRKPYEQLKEGMVGGKKKIQRWGCLALSYIIKLIVVQGRIEERTGRGQGEKQMHKELGLITVRCRYSLVLFGFRLERIKKNGETRKSSIQRATLIRVSRGKVRGRVTACPIWLLCAEREGLQNRRIARFGRRSNGN